jgi:HlyD family secretion protein
MIKNPPRRPTLLAVLVGLASSCQPAPAHPGAFQGVVELEERVLGFEAGGRVLAVSVQRGAAVQPGDTLAALDDALARTAREAREAEASAADARLALLRAGARSEDVKAMSAEIAAARASEDLLQKEVTRARALVETGTLAQAALDQAEAGLASQKARRQALEERLRGLRNGPRKQEIDTADAQARAAGKAVTLESERLARHTLRAHAAGTVLDVHVDPGEVVAPGTPIVTLADTARPYIDVFVPQAPVAPLRRLSSPCATCPSPSAAARSSACSAPTARASPPPSACCAASSTPAAARHRGGLRHRAPTPSASRSASAT